MFSTTWSYLDHVVVPAGASTPELPHQAVAEAYYVLSGEGTDLCQRLTASWRGLNKAMDHLLEGDEYDDR